MSDSGTEAASVALEPTSSGQSQSASVGGGIDATRSERPKAILICYCCGPGEGSEAGAGWAWTRAAAEVADVVLLTTSYFRESIEKAIAKEDLPIQVRWVDYGCWAKFIHPYLRWLVHATRAVRRCEKEQHIDVAHHITLASDSLPTPILASRAPIRIWGPVGGATRTTWGLYRYLTLRGVLGEIQRDILNGICRLTTGAWVARRATLLVALNRDVASWWGTRKKPMVVESNTALYEEELYRAKAAARSLDGESQERVAVFAGRLIPWKGIRLAIETVAHAPGWKLVVMGTGPERVPAEGLARKLGVAERVEFRGEVEREEALKQFTLADAMLFLSFHDSAPWAVAEASALGCPVVCLDAGGPASQAGPNAHVVAIKPTRTLPRRVAHELNALDERGKKDRHLEATRLPALLKTWYSTPVRVNEFPSTK